MGKQLSYDEGFDAVTRQTEIRSQLELCHVLNIRQSLASDAKRRNIFPEEWCRKLQELYPGLIF